jgi:hypothetical protein
MTETGRPAEAARFDNDAAQCMAVAAQELGGRVADDVRTPSERLAEIGGRQGIVDDQPDARLVSDCRHLFEVEDDATGIGASLDKDRLDPRD